MNATRWKLLGSLLIVLLGVALLRQLKDVQFSEILSTMGRFPLATLLGALALAMLQVVAQSLRLWTLLPRSAASGVARVKLLRVLEVFSQGQFVNMFLPGRVGDGLKVVAFAKGEGSGLSMAQAAGGVLVADKLMDVLALVGLGLVLLVVVRPDWLNELRLPAGNGSAVLWVLAGLLGLALLIYFLRYFFWRRYAARLRQHVGHFLESVRGMFKLTRFVPAIGAGMGAWGCEGSIILLLCHALGFDLSFAHAFWVLIVLNLGIAIPVSFASVGTFEASMAFGLSRYGVPLGEALAIAATHHLLQVAGIGVWAGCFYLRSFFRRSLLKGAS